MRIYRLHGSNRNDYSVFYPRGKTLIWQHEPGALETMTCLQFPAKLQLENNARAKTYTCLKLLVIFIFIFYLYDT